MEPEVLYEDNHLLVVCKPVGILTQNSGTEQINLEDICKEWIKKVANKPGNVFLGTIHRLDKPVSGIVIFAKTSKALARVNASMRAQSLKKIYTAVVEGTIPKKQATLEHYLYHDDYKAVVVNKNTPQAKLCRLHYKVLQENTKYSLVEIELETGRYHQIRAQLAASGYPVVGDGKYGSKTPYIAQAIALHHSSLDFPHPTKDEIIQIRTEIPKSFLAFFNK